MKKRLERLSKRLELSAIAVTYAEAGEWRVAEDYLKKIDELSRNKTPKVLVVSLDSAFSAKTAEYSVNMAERMRYDLVALQTIRPENRKSFLHSGDTARVKRSARQVFGDMVDKARGRGVRLETLIAVCDFHRQIKRLLQQIKQIELVFIQVEKGNQISLNLNVPVYEIEVGEAC